MVCRLRLVLLTLPAKVLVIEASAVGAPQTGQLPSCTDSCISADRIRTHAISLYITAQPTSYNNYIGLLNYIIILYLRVHAAINLNKHQLRIRHIHMHSTCQRVNYNNACMWVIIIMVSYYWHMQVFLRRSLVPRPIFFY